jgi:hypothetical protein
LCLTSTQSVVINAGSTTNLTGNQGQDLIPGWNSGQRYASFRIGDYFGIWLAYSTADVYKVYDYVGNNVISLTASVGTRLNYTGNVAVITDDSAGVEYVINSTTLGASPSYVTYSTISDILHYGIKSQYVDGDTTPSLMINLNEGNGGTVTSRMFTDTGVHDFELPFTWYRWLSQEYSIHLEINVNLILYFYDWSGNLLATVDTGIADGTSYAAELIKDRLYFKIVDGSTITYYYFTPTKSDSITIENATEAQWLVDDWSWWIS